MNTKIEVHHKLGVERFVIATTLALAHFNGACCPDALQGKIGPSGPQQLPF